MIEIILKDKKEEDKMEAFIKFLKLLNIEAILKHEYHFDVRTKVDFSLSAGIWKEYSIDGNQSRKKSWDII